jgi:hypothetical protein
MKKLFNLTLLFCILSICAGAQTYYAVTHYTGTQPVGPLNVTVSPIATPSTWNTPYCTANNWRYYIGNGPQSIGYKYEFSSPVNKVRFYLAAQNAGEIISFKINGGKYFLTSANISAHLATCHPGVPVAINGDLEITSGAGNAMVTITNTGAIDSISVNHLGSFSIGGTLYAMEIANDSSIYISEPYYDTLYCAGDSIHVPFITSIRFQSNNVFNLQLSNSSGSFATPVVIGYLNSDTTGTVHGKIPITASGNGYRVRIVATNPVLNSPANTFNIRIKPSPIPTANVNSPICAGQQLNFTANALTGSTYAWTGPNGFTSTQQYPAIPSATTAATGDYIVTAMLDGCSAKDTVTATVKTQPTIPLAGANTQLCETETLNLTATSTTPGVSYNWTGPNSFSSVFQNPTIANTTTAASGTYIVTTSLNGCISQGNINVLVRQTPAAPIAGSNSPVCKGGVLSLTANSLTPGVNYDWTGPGGFTSNQQNPVIDPANTTHSGTYTVTASLNGCVSAAGTAQIQVNAVAYLGAYASPNDTLCEGKTLTVVTVPINGGGNPQFQWYKNNNPIAGATNLTYPTTTAVTGDSFYCRMIATNVCNTPLTLFSDKIGITVLPKDPSPSVNITSTPANPLPGNMVSFTANVTNGGANPQYQWKRNGQDIVGAVQSTWSASNLNPNDKISLVVTSSLACPDSTNANSNVIEIAFPVTVHQLHEASGIQLYPNPNKGTFQLTGHTGEVGQVDVEILNAIGQVVYKETAATTNGKLDNTINLHESNGIYLLKIQAKGIREVIRFVISK